MLPVFQPQQTNKGSPRLRSRHRSPNCLTLAISSGAALGRRSSPGSPLDYPRNHSPHYRVRRRDCHRLDDRHHRLDSGRDTRAARDGRSRGRRPQALFLSAPGYATTMPAARLALAASCTLALRHERHARSLTSAVSALSVIARHAGIGWAVPASGRCAVRRSPQPPDLPGA